MRSIGEVVAIYMDRKPAVYGRIEGYDLDRKPHWLNVRILLLTFPAKEITWIIREEQLDGELFTMDGIPVQILDVPGMKTEAPVPPSTPPGDNKKNDTVIPLAQRMKKTT